MLSAEIIGVIVTSAVLAVLLTMLTRQYGADWVWVFLL